MEASIIIPIRVVRPIYEVYLVNLPYALGAAAAQDMAAERILVDYGSHADYVQKIMSIAKENKFVYVRAEGEVWSRSKALNVGIKSAKGRCIFFVDADCVIPVSYINVNVGAINSAAFTFCPVYDSKKDIALTGSYVELLKCVRGQGVMTTRPDGFSHMGVLSSWFTAHGGYNEAYEGWGGEDNDLFVRLTRSGVRARQTSVNPIHLWHPTYEQLMTKDGKKEVYDRLLTQNRTRFFNFRDGK